MPLTSPAFFSARWRIFHERRSRTVVHHSCLNRGSIYERYHLFSEANEIYGLDLSSSNTSHKYSSSVDRSIDFYPPGKPLSLHVCVRSCINFVVMIPTFFLESCHPFGKSRGHQTFDRFWFAVQRDGSVRRRIFDHIDRISRRFSRGFTWKRQIFKREGFQRWPWIKLDRIELDPPPFLNALLFKVTRYFVLFDKKFQFIFRVNFIVKDNAYKNLG